MYNSLTDLQDMDELHLYGVDFVYYLQKRFQNHDEVMLAASHLGDPRNAFLLYFPVSYCLHKPTGVLVLWIAAVSEWINAILKWLLHGDRPYWWILDPRNGYSNSTLILQQYRLTCETGPGSPSGHAMVTASVMFCLVRAMTSMMKPRTYKWWILWLAFIVFMLAVCISRLFIATHFPHQVVLGTFIGLCLAGVIYNVDIQHLQFVHYLGISVIIPASCIVTFYLLLWFGLDPQWSISLATKYCANSAWVHLDTTLFNAAYRDAGSVLGLGIFVSLVSRLSSASVSDKENSRDKSSTNSVFSKLGNIVICLIVGQLIEQCKPFHSQAMIYYCVTYVKFCVLVVVVMSVELLGSKNMIGKLEQKRI